MTGIVGVIRTVSKEGARIVAPAVSGQIVWSDFSVTIARPVQIGLIEE